MTTPGAAHMACMMSAIVFDIESGGREIGEARLDFIGQADQAGSVFRKGFTVIWLNTPVVT